MRVVSDYDAIVRRRSSTRIRRFDQRKRVRSEDRKRDDCYHQRIVRFHTKTLSAGLSGCYKASGGFCGDAEERIATPTSGRGVRGTELRPAISVSRFPWRNRSRIGTGHFAMSRLRDQPFVIRQRVDVDLALWKWKF